MSISLLLCVCLFFGYCLLSLHIFILPHLLLSTFYFFSGAIFTTRCTWDMKEDCVAKWIDEAGGEMPFLNLFYPTLLYSTPFYSTPCCSIPSYSTLYSTSFYYIYLLIHSSLLFDFSLQFASFSLICSFLKYIIGEAQKRISCHDCLLLSHYDILFSFFSSTIRCSNYACCW